MTVKVVVVELPLGVPEMTPSGDTDAQSPLAVPLENVTVQSTEFVAAGTNVSVYVPESCMSASYQVVSSDLCRATMNVSTSDRSGIRLEAWFPQNYTGRFLSTGNGGIGGCK